MNEQQIKSSLRAAAYALSALLGWSRAVKFIKSVADEIENEAWSGHGSR